MFAVLGKHWPLQAVLSAALLLSGTIAHSACTFGSGSVTFGLAPNTISTRQIYDGSIVAPQGQVSSGAYCDSVINLLVVQMVKAKLTGSTNGLKLKRVGGSQTIPYQIFPNNTYTNPWTVGSTWDYTTLDVLSLFLGLGNTLPFYVRIPVGGPDVPQGTYQDTLTFFWDLNICAVGVAACVVPSYVGTGTTTVTVTLQAAKSCTVSATNINFGSLPLLSQAVTQQGTVSVNCSLGEGYQLGFDNGDNALGTLRRLYNATTNQYIKYRVLKMDNTEWHYTWGGADVVSALGAGHSGAGGNQTFKVTIDAGQTTPPPAIYTDRMRVLVYF